MSAVVTVSRNPRRATVPGRVLVPWVLAALGCFVMALGLGFAPPQADPVPVRQTFLEASQPADRSSLESAAMADAEMGRAAAGADGAIAAGSSVLKTLAILVFVSALLAAVMGSYRGYALNGD